MTGVPKGLRAGDGADEVVVRYRRRLLALARVRISPRLACREDAEDVVQSAFRTFLGAARRGHLGTMSDDDTWRFLAALTVNKVRRKAEHHRAGLRSIDRECPADPALEALDRGPGPTELAELFDTLDVVLREFQPLHRRMIESKLRGCEVSAIAAEVGRSERMVNVVLRRFRGRIEQRFDLPRG